MRKLVIVVATAMSVFLFGAITTAGATDIAIPVIKVFNNSGQSSPGLGSVGVLVIRLDPPGNPADIFLPQKTVQSVPQGSVINIWSFRSCIDITWNGKREVRNGVPHYSAPDGYIYSFNIVSPELTPAAYGQYLNITGLNCS